MCVCEGVCVCVCVYTTGKDIQIYTLWNNGSDFSQASKNPLRNKGKNKTNQKVTWAWIIFFCSLKTPGNREALLICLVDLLSISVLKVVFNQAYPKKMLLPNPVTSSSFDWFFCFWGLRTLGGGENPSWGYISSGLGCYRCSWVLILAQDPQHCWVSLHLLTQKSLYLWPRSLSLSLCWWYSFILWPWSGVTVKGDEGIEIHPRRRPQGPENHKWLCYTKETTWEERRWALFPLNHGHSGTSSNVHNMPCEYTHSFWKPMHWSNEKHLLISDNVNILGGFKYIKIKIQNNHT